MTGLAQVGHIVRKDLLEHRWALIVYAALVAVATISALSPDGPSAISSGLIMPLVVLFGMIETASLVQGDSPVRSDAFWASRPLDPHAVFAAKILTIVVILIGIPLAGQLGALAAHDISPMDLPAATVESAWAYWKWLLFALVVGAMTRDLKTFVVALMIVPAVLVPVTIWAAANGKSAVNIGEPVSETVRAWPAWVMMVVGVTGGVALVWHLYRSRDARPWTWVAGVVLLMCASQATGPLPDAYARELNRARIRQSASFRVEKGMLTSMNGVPQFSAMLTLDSLPNRQRLTLFDPVLTVIDRAGDSVRIVLRDARRDIGLKSHAIEHVTWLGSAATTSWGVGLQTPWTDTLRAVDRTGLASLGVEGRMLVRVPGSADTLELRNGTVLARRGMTMRVSGWNFGNGQASLKLAIAETVSGFEQADSDFPGDDNTEYALVNESRHEAMQLETVGGSGNNGFLVLPGAHLKESTASLVTRTGRTFHEELAITDDWFAGARLVVAHWVAAGSYPVRVQTTVP
jgi:hypothetical protein